jgi:N-methylhydantoinase B
MMGLNKMLAVSPAYRHRAQTVSDGCMATFNLGGINQFGEPFGLHLMDPIAGGSGAWATKDGADAGGPISSPVSSIADIERNEQVSPLFYLHRRLACDTGGAGKYRGGATAEVALTLGGIERAEALIMTHGAEVPNSAGLAGGWPGSTVRQSMGRGAIENGRPKDGKWEVFGPKPGLMDMTNRDVFAVTWQGCGGWGDPLERDLDDAQRDLDAGRVSPRAAKELYGVVSRAGRVNRKASERLREAMRLARVGTFATEASQFCHVAPFARLGASLALARDERGTHVVSNAGYILATGHTQWRKRAVARTMDRLPKVQAISLHEELAVTAYYCPASGAQLSVDVHRKDEAPRDDLDLDLASVEALNSAGRSA